MSAQDRIVGMRQDAQIRACEVDTRVGARVDGEVGRPSVGAARPNPDRRSLVHPADGQTLQKTETTLSLRCSGHIPNWGRCSGGCIAPSWSSAQAPK
jgi:hypothetical protein